MWLVDKLFDHIWDSCETRAKKYIRNRKRLKELNTQREKIAEKYRSDVYERLGEKEQFNFTALDEFLQQKLLSDVALCFNASTPKQRTYARETLFSMAYQKANANTQQEKRSVHAYVECVLNLIDNYFLSEEDNKLFLANRTVDQMKEMMVECEKTLLNRMDQLSKQIDYQGSFAEMVDNLPKKHSSTTRFHYLNHAIGFYGRNNEMKSLDQFLDDKHHLLFAAVVGSGGSGKSKLVFHYSQQLCGWKAVYLSKDDIERMLNFSHWRYPDELLLIVDYAGEMSGNLGKLLYRMLQAEKDALPVKTRFLLLERQGCAQGQQESAQSQMKSIIWPDWYERLLRGDDRRGGEREDVLKQFHHTFDQNPFLELSPLDETSLRQMTNDYAKTENKSISDVQWKEIFSTAQKIEKVDTACLALPRPLLALLITDVSLYGDDFCNWNFNDVLIHVLNRYENHWKLSLCNRDEVLFNSIKRLLLWATVTGGLELNKPIPQAIKPQVETLFKLDQNRWQILVCGLNSDVEYHDEIKPLEPDLIGEYFVLNTLCDVSPLERPQLLEALWETEPEIVHAFFNRCIQDFVGKNIDFHTNKGVIRFATFQKLFQNAMNQLLPQNVKEKWPLLVTVLLANLTCYSQNVTERTKAVTEMETLTKQFNDQHPLLLSVYSVGLLNLSYSQQLGEAEQTVDKLQELVEKYKDQPLVAFNYATALGSLLRLESPEKAEKIIEKLQELAEQYKGQTEIALECAKSLAELAHQPGKANRIEKTLYTLAEQYGDRQPEIIRAYAYVIRRCFYDQPPENAEDIETVTIKMNKLMKIISPQQYDYNQRTDLELDLLSEYIKGLSIVWAMLPIHGVPEVNDYLFTQLPKMFKGFEHLMSEIALEYAEGCATISTQLSIEKSMDDKEKVVETLFTLTKLYGDYQPRIVSYCASKIVRIVLVDKVVPLNDLKKMKKIVKKLKIITDKYGDLQPVIAVGYARCIVHISLNRWYYKISQSQPIEVKKLVKALQILTEQLQILTERYGDKRTEIAEIYAQVLSLSPSIYTAEEMKIIMEKLQWLESRYGNLEPEIALEYANCLFNYFITQTTQTRMDTLNKLRTMSEKYPDQSQITKLYTDANNKA